MAGADPRTAPGDAPRRLVLSAILALGLSCVMTQLALLREMLCVFAGNELVLGVALGNWLLLMGLGAALGRWAHRLKEPSGVLAALLIFTAVTPLGQVFALRGLRHSFFLRGAEIGVIPTVVASFVILLPYCLAAGFMLTLACWLLAQHGDARGPGRVYVADSLGSIAEELAGEEAVELRRGRIGQGHDDDVVFRAGAPDELARIAGEQAQPGVFEFLRQKPAARRDHLRVNLDAVQLADAVAENLTRGTGENAGDQQHPARAGTLDHRVMRRLLGEFEVRHGGHGHAVFQEVDLPAGFRGDKPAVG